MNIKILLRGFATNYLAMVSSELSLDDLHGRLEMIKNRSKQSNSQIILPLVGEFSSGKTSLLNALTDAKRLETASKPTTATIYEIHFGCEKSYATILDNDGVEQVIDDLSNDLLSDKNIVTIYDTSKRVPSSTILVDTPGLSSPDIRHKQTLVEALPKADAVLLVTDINQQITRSLLEFVETMKLANTPVFLIVTKCDTKSSSDITQVLDYISKNIDLPIEHIACVSAINDNLDEVYTLLNKIQANKNAIIEQVNKQRIETIRRAVIEHIDELLLAASNEGKMDVEMDNCGRELNQLESSIKRIIDSVSNDVEMCESDAISKFKSTVSKNLYSVATSNTTDFDSAAESTINNTLTIIINSYKERIDKTIKSRISALSRRDNGISVSLLETIDLSQLSIPNINYDINLNGIGHEYDSAIQGAVTIGGNAVAAFATGDVTGVVASTVIDFANNNLNIIGKITDSTLGKPQRKRAIIDYIDTCLISEFKEIMRQARSEVTFLISDGLQKSNEELLTQKSEALKTLKKECAQQKELFNTHIATIKGYKAELLN